MASQCVLTKKAFVQQSVHLHTYSKSAIKSVTACIDKPLCESDCHTRPFNSPPSPPSLVEQTEQYWTRCRVIELDIDHGSLWKAEGKWKRKDSSCLLKNHWIFETSNQCPLLSPCGHWRRSEKHYQSYLHVICSKIMCQVIKASHGLSVLISFWWFSTVKDNPVWGKWVKGNCLLFWVCALIPALRGLACVHDCVSVSVHACASHTNFLQ